MSSFIYYNKLYGLSIYKINAFWTTVFQIIRMSKFLEPPLLKKTRIVSYEYVHTSKAVFYRIRINAFGWLLLLVQ